MHIYTATKRRDLLRNMMLSGAALTVPGVFAEALSLTPKQVEGPFYPDKMPLDTDNDLLRINDKLTTKVGTVAHLSGRVLSKSGEPVRNAVIEIWQVDGNGVYLHSRSDNGDKRDANFQGYGRFLTDAKGRYYFRTVKPVAYPGRTPHIHVMVNANGKRALTTQCYIKGHPRNARDGLLRRAGDKKQQELLMADFKPLKGSAAGELEAEWDVVIGVTPVDAK
jgi:protocatechuate 3,4-dioxygenase beta subunit